MCSVIARYTDLQHPLGCRIRTPLLIPSFSSKGFARPNGRSEIYDIFEAATEILWQSMLVSAYDLHHGHLPAIDESITEITIVDSGGYETSDYEDLSSPIVYGNSGGEWSDQLHIKTLDAWPDHIPAVFVSYDRAYLPIGEQIERAIELTEKYPRQLHAFLAKPEQGHNEINVGAIITHAKNLARFAILGVTEKEIGPSIISRMKTIAQLRLAMDHAGLRQVPIHVFGGLDPMSVCLYFIAGAEIFDGLTWLRYAYVFDSAMYRQNGAIVHERLTESDSWIRTWAMTQNAGQLEALRNQLRIFLNDRNYAVLPGPDNGEWLRRAKELLRAEFDGREL